MKIPGHTLYVFEFYQGCNGVSRMMFKFQSTTPTPVQVAFAYLFGSCGSSTFLYVGQVKIAL